MCGVVGVYGPSKAAQLAFDMMQALQHRGQESYGLKVSHRGKIRGPNPQPGLLSPEFFNRISGLEGRLAIAHLRYSTAGGHNPEDDQPIAYDDLAIAHNGNITNAAELRAGLKAVGRTFVTPGSDTEPILQLAATSQQKAIEDKFIEALGYVQGAYSITAIWKDTLIIARDPHGYRPLAIGQLGNEFYAAASETQALERIRATKIREVERGELITINARGYRSRKFSSIVPDQKCLMELIYFAKPSGPIFGLKKGITWIREEHGRLLASSEKDFNAEVVVPVPDSGVQAAIGYAAQSGIPYRMGLIRSHSAGRTFILPHPELRTRAVSQKLAPVKDVLEEKIVVLIDDSIVRGTTAQQIVAMVRRAGAKEVHLRIASPPITNPCYYGIDTPTKEELIASNKTVDEVRAFLKADSLRYLSLEDLHKPINDLEQLAGRNSCDACFTGEYANNIPVGRLPIIRV
ncbi:amidophosphoribosyltransferase [Candidatus Woesearchaeota archaeon]|nr:amidophosphoribosyltransferase [Candidatus Woesearchaeota archaeon]